MRKDPKKSPVYLQDIFGLTVYTPEPEENKERDIQEFVSLARQMRCEELAA